MRDLVARREPIYEFAIRSILRDYDLDTAEGRVAALQRCVPLVAHIKREELRDEYARRLAGWTACRTSSRSSGGSASRRARPPSGRVVRGRPRRSRPATTRACTGSARCSSPRFRFPRSPGPPTTSCPRRRSPSYMSRCTGGAGGGWSVRRAEGSAWLEAVVAECPPDAGLVSELAVEPLEPPARTPTRCGT